MAHYFHLFKKITRDASIIQTSRGKTGFKIILLCFFFLTKRGYSAKSAAHLYFSPFFTLLFILKALF